MYIFQSEQVIKLQTAILT